MVTQIEACVNSRPICPLSESIDDLEILTPGHFLVGSALTAPLECDLTELKMNQVNRWELCSKMKQEFWNRWSTDYMALLQKKVKWTEKKANLKEGDMVLVMDEQRIPLRWPVGRVTKIYAGSDGLVRVVDVYTKGKTYKRPVGKLALLPIDNTIDEKAVEEPIVKEAKATEASTKNEKVVKKRTLIKPPPVKSFVVTILAMLALINGVFAKSGKFSLNIFPQNSSVYTESCTKTAVATGHWNLIMHYGMNEYFDEMNKINQLINEFGSMCESRSVYKKEVLACKSLLVHIDTKMSTINTNHLSIKMEMSGRKKRGVIIGSIVGTLAGVIGTKIYDWVRDSSSMENIEELARNEISVIELVESKLQNMSHALHTTELFENEVYFMVYLLEKISELEKKQHKIVKLITEKQMKLTTDIIKVDELKKHIELITTKMESDTLLGVTALEKTLNVYKLVKNPEIMVNDDSIIFAIRIPLIKAIFECQKIYPQMITTKSGNFELNIEKNYVLINKTLGAYATMTNAQMNECTKLKTVTVCELQKTHKISASKHSCEFNVLRNSHDECNTKQIATDARWIKLHGNEWIYNAAVHQSITIKCANARQDFEIKGNGRVIFPEKCIIESDSEWIQSEYSVTTDVEMSNKKWRVIKFPPGKKDEIEANNLHNKIEQLKMNYENKNSTYNIYIIAGICANFVLLLFFNRKNNGEIIINPPKIVN